MINRKNYPKKSETAGAAGAAAAFDPVAGKSVAEIFGEIVWLMSRDTEVRELPIKDLEWLVMPPILLKQFHITYAPVPEGRTVAGEAVSKVGAGSNANPRLQPVGVELYAMCSDAVAAALDAAAPGKVALAMQDWRGGANKRVVRKVVLSGASG